MDGSANVSLLMSGKLPISGLARTDLASHKLQVIPSKQNFLASSHAAHVSERARDSDDAPFSTSSLKTKPPLCPSQIPFIRIDYTLNREVQLQCQITPASLREKRPCKHEEQCTKSGLGRQ